MNLQDAKFKGFALVREMLETPDIIQRFDFDQAVEEPTDFSWGQVFLTGEGSSRIFPAKNMIYERMRRGHALPIMTDGARQAREYDLTDTVVFGASNSGKTKEVISLFTELASRGHPALYGLTATPGSPLEGLCTRCYTLTCGKENAVAATKSVVEQAIFYAGMLPTICGINRGPNPLRTHQRLAAEKAKEVLETELEPEMVRRIAAAPTVYFAGRNNGVAEELALKTNEITHKKSDYLEGTYAVHGIEEVMRGDEVVIVIDPFPEEMQKFKEVLVDGVGLKVIAVASRETIFPTIRIPDVEGYQTVLQLLAGWNILVHVGVALGINLDKAQRARKIGNEAAAVP